MDGGGHDVAAVERLLHHHFVEGCRVAPGPLVTGGYLLVHRREQRAGPAGEVPDSQPADGLSIRPVHALQLGDGQPGQQCRRRGQGVEGGQVLAVGNKSLEDAAGQVVGVSTPVALTAWAVCLSRRRMSAASPDGSCSRMSLAMAKMAQ